MRNIVRSSQQRSRSYWLLLIGFVIVLAMVVRVVSYFPRRAAHAAVGDWTTYLGGNAHTGYDSSETIITPATAPSLKLRWTAQAAGHVSSEPLVVNGVVYWGSWDGTMYATSASTGQNIWTANLGFKPDSCGGQSLGVIGTPTIATVSINGASTQALFIGAGQDNLYALDTSNGHILWQTNLGNAPGEILYGSTVFYNGSVYIGVGSSGDCPLVQGQIVQVNASTGAITRPPFPVVPPGCIGAGVWSTPTIDQATGMLYFDSGNGNPNGCPTTEPLGSAVVELHASDLSLVASWHPSIDVASADFDFGSTPTLFQATIGGSIRQMIGLEGKDGNYYALDRTNISAGPVWQDQISVGGRNPELGLGSMSSSAYDGTDLYIAGGNTTINGQTCGGSLRAVDPNTGHYIWQLCQSSPALDGMMAAPGLVVGGWGNIMNVVAAATGKVLFSYQDTTSNAKFWGSATISDGVLYDGSRSGNMFAFWIGTTATPAPGTGPTATQSPTLGSGGPVNTTWYFAEGRVGKGFREYLTIGNPTANACAVNVQYLYTMDGSSAPSSKTVSLTVAPVSRSTESVNTDLGLADSSTSAASLAAIVRVNATSTPSCTGVVAERPMYFSNYHGISSGTDVVGDTHLNTTYSFADVPTGSSSSGNYTSYITILNPNASVANVTVNYYANGTKVQSQTLQVPANARGTIAPGAVPMPQHVAAVVTSNQPIMVERPTYFSAVNGIAGAYDVVGAPTVASDWLFAEGFTGTGYQEYLTLANLDPAKTATATITLKSGSGATNATTLSLGPQSQMIWNVNRANTFSGATPEVSAEVATALSGASIVVQREIYFTYKHTLQQSAMGGTDVMGQTGPASHIAYSFAEGYTNTGYNTWLTLQNPTGAAETIYVTLVNGAAKTSTRSYPVQAHSRFTLDVTALVQQVFSPGTSSVGNAISMTVQTLDSSAFVAERPMYWNTSAVSPFVTAGGSDVFGYVGN